MILVIRRSRTAQSSFIRSCGIDTMTVEVFGDMLENMSVIRASSARSNTKQVRTTEYPDCSMDWLA
ncbi:MAG: hypothetical protein ACI89X_003709 [Planctomycetota bacterium]|jgi:hypothetical protein